jgi:hypothetical protein
MMKTKSDDSLVTLATAAAELEGWRSAFLGRVPSGLVVVGRGLRQSSRIAAARTQVSQDEQPIGARRPGPPMELVVAAAGARQQCPGRATPPPPPPRRDCRPADSSQATTAAAAVCRR